MGENNISVKSLCKSFEGFTLNNVSLQVPKGRIVGFIGENGCIYVSKESLKKSLNLLIISGTSSFFSIAL